MSQRDKKICIVSNSYWNLFNFRFELIKNLSTTYDITLIGNYDQYYNLFTSLKCKRLIINYPKNKINIIQDLKLIYTLYKIFKKSKPDILLNYTIKPVIYCSFLQFFFKFKVINTITGLGTLYLKNKLLKFIFIKLYYYSQKNVNKIIFQNTEDEKIFNNLKIANSKNSIVIPGSGVNTDYFKSNIYPKNKVTNFLFVGRLIKEKGILELCNAFKSLNKNIKFKLTIVGLTDKKNPADVSHILLKSIKGMENVSIVLNEYDIKKYYENCHCLILPSYREGLSKSCLEAMSMSRPIIVSDVPGCRDLVFNNTNGLIFNHKNINDIVTKINYFINISIEDKIKMGKFSRKYATEHFSSKIILKMYEQILLLKK